MEVRTIQTETTDFLYTAANMAEDFPAGPDPAATLQVAQFGASFGWGVEAQARLFS
jgi:hypothetical protein